MDMPFFEMPVRHRASERRGTVSLRRPALEGDRSRIRIPAAAPEDNIVVVEPVPGLELSNVPGCKLRIAPYERPPLLLVRMPHALHPVGYSLDLARVVVGCQ